MDEEGKHSFTWITRLTDTGINLIEKDQILILNNHSKYIMDEKNEDKSEESKKRHRVYYTSLNKIISNMKNEINEEGQPAIKEHLTSRIDAMLKDQKRIRDLFPNITKEEWDGNSN